MAMMFVIPSSLRDLETPSESGDHLCAQDVTDVEKLSASEVDELVKDVAYELVDKEVWCIEEQDVFDKVYSLIRGFPFLEPSARGSLVESLCSNLAVLITSITAQSHASSESTEDAAYMLQQMHLHRNALKIYSYFLQCVLIMEEAAEVKPVLKATTGKGKKVHPRKEPVPAKWSWDVPRTRIVRLLATTVEIDLRHLYSMSQPENDFIALFAEAAFLLLENSAYTKEKDLKDALCNILAACAAKYGYIVPVTSTILNLLHKYEHLSVHLAEVVSMAEEKYHDRGLPMSILRGIGHINPLDLKRDNFGADSVSSFLVAMAERMARFMTDNLSIITPHLNGESYKMRNAIVQVIGTLLAKASKDSSGDVAGDEMTLLRCKQGMIDILLDRARDKSSYTRSKVLQTWAKLCVESAISIGHWNSVVQVAVGRLEDKAAIVRKSALQLLTTLLQFNPFGPSLRISQFEYTIQQFKEKLKEMTSIYVNLNEADPHLVEPENRVGVNRDEASEEVNGDQVEGTPNSQFDHTDPSQIQPEPHEPNATDTGGLERSRAMVASLESGLQFSCCIVGVMDVLAQLLASSCSDDVKHTITLLVLACQFEIDGAQMNLLKMLPLVFSQEPSVCEAVEGAFAALYMKPSPSETAQNLLKLALDASIGDIVCIEAIVMKLTKNGTISQSTVAALWNYFTFNAADVTPQKSRGALVVLCMAARSKPQILSSQLKSMICICLSRRAGEDSLIARYACIALQRLSDADRVGLGPNHKIFSVLASLIIGPGLSEEVWYSAAEQAINAIYALHPTPEKLVSGLLLQFCKSVFGTFQEIDIECSSRGVPTASDNGVPVSPLRVGFDMIEPRASHLSRFLFTLAHIALKHLVYVESCVRKLRKQIADKEKAAADTVAAAQFSDGGTSCRLASSEVENIDTELGMAASEDARIDSLLERTAIEIISGDRSQKFLIDDMAPIVAKICRNSGLMQQYPRLGSSAMLALCKLMAINGDFCDQNLQLLFTVAQSSGDSAVRSNCIIALGDLAFRFPNVLEPWTEHMYSPLNDKDRKVRKNAVLVLTHLILNDVVKVNGHICEMVLRLEDEDERIRNLVKLFVQELANKGNNPIYNHLPDIISRLSCNSELSQDTFRNVVEFFISTITKDRLKEALIEKLCQRFPGTSDVKLWTDLSYCMAQLNYTDKSLKRIIELIPKFQNALGEEEVVEHFRSIVSKAKKSANPEVKGMAHDFESRIGKFHEERKEHDLAERNAQAHRSSACESTGSLHTQCNEHVGGRGFEEQCELEDSRAGATVVLGNIADTNKNAGVTAEDETNTLGINRLEAPYFSEELIAKERMKQYLRSHDSHMTADTTSAINENPKSNTDVTRARSLETSLKLIDKMNDEEADTVGKNTSGRISPNATETHNEVESREKRKKPIRRIATNRSTSTPQRTCSTNFPPLARRRVMNQTRLLAVVSFGVVWGSGRNVREQEMKGDSWRASSASAQLEGSVNEKGHSLLVDGDADQSRSCEQPSEAATKIMSQFVMSRTETSKAHDGLQAEAGQVACGSQGHRTEGHIWIAILCRPCVCTCYSVHYT
ncbi:condensin-1 complex subunit CAP-D2 isoform X6 [Physcomitrium patens]|uniref:condensin-1 complex subunit CAP-D2 isoform X6 n=1 Tax=Physcomitrium patens TaxID=3218 RepID=UPI000D17DCDB|nr:condensin complex subunit 1-like isoform X5 [Physcomitrium patens]|eukprot:XP_024390641.1 condensin complex subunit 1-like isoform X5 [Physcomitrella patens]